MEKQKEHTPEPKEHVEPKTESVLAISPAGVIVKMRLHPGQKLKDGWKLAPAGSKYLDRPAAKELEASKLKAAGGALEKDKK